MLMRTSKVEMLTYVTLSMTVSLWPFG